MTTGSAMLRVHREHMAEGLRGGTMVGPVLHAGGSDAFVQFFAVSIVIFLGTIALLDRTLMRSPFARGSRRRQAQAPRRLVH
jgi:hypothetical protein